MPSLLLFLLFCQMLGAGVGIGWAIWSELAYLKAVRDGEISSAERAHLGAVAKGLRWGMSLLLLSSVGVIIVAYALHFPVQPAQTEAFWIFMALALLVILLVWALSRKRVSFALGSAAALSAWWMIAYLAFDRLPVSFGSAVAFYVVLTAVLYAVLRLLRALALSHTAPRHDSAR